MGTFAGFFEMGDEGISDGKLEEFVERVQKVYQSGGMMDVDIIQLHGKRIATIRKAEMSSKGMDFFYNYFEDTRWENAGFNRETNRVWSNKIGWSHFHQAVVAAYVLQEQYTENVAVAMVDGEPINYWKYVGWLNYLFNEKKHIKNYDAWKLFEAYHDSDDEYLCWDDWHIWNGFGCARYAFISGCEIYAVLHGTDEAILKFETKEKGELEQIAFDGMKFIQEILQQYSNDKTKEDRDMCQDIINEIRIFFSNNQQEAEVEQGDKKYTKLLSGLNISDAPAFVIKGLSEIFDKDFWDLWSQVRDVVRRKHEKLYGNQDYYIVPISTEEFFHQSPDDMIPYWENNNKIVFSEELWDWFHSLKRESDIMMENDNPVENLLNYMTELLVEADENYYNIFAFSDFVEESLNNSNDMRYQVLWRLFDKMIHDPELMKAGDVIFVPEGPEHESEGLHYWGEQPKRRLKSNWDFIKMSEKNNKGRVTLRRYMALVGNKLLRRELFGF